MRAPWIAAPLLLAALAGCFASDGGSEDRGPVSPAADAKAWSFDAGRTRVEPLGDPPGSPRFHYTGFTGAEPNIGITSSGAVFVTAFEETIRSDDGGATWASVHQYRMGQGLSDIGTSDPMLWVDVDTDRVFVNHMWQLNCYNMLWSDDDGGSWTQRDLACFSPGVDHQKVMTAPPGPDPNGQAAVMPVYENVVYTCYSKILATDCFASFDGGLTYTQESNVFSPATTGCSGPAGHPAAAPDGTIAIAIGWECGPLVAVSRDSGLTWTVHDGPQESGAGASIDPDLTITPDGTMYLFWRDADHMARVARSPDMGATWDAVWNITAPGLTSTRFHVLSSGTDGRIAMAYLGTDQPRGDDWRGRPHDAPPEALWHLYIVTSEDAGSADPTFTSYQVTPDEDPVQKGCAWEGGGGGGERRCRNMLDFIDSVGHPDGTFYVTYTEGCTFREDGGKCAEDPAGADEMDSRDREVAVAALDGWSLLG